MATLTRPSMVGGLHLSADELNSIGVELDHPARIEITALPSAWDIQRFALRHAIRRLGDAIQIDKPDWRGDGWSVGLLSHDGRDRIGCLQYSAEGELDEARSELPAVARPSGSFPAKASERKRG